MLLVLWRDFRDFLLIDRVKDFDDSELGWERILLCSDKEGSRGRNQLCLWCVCIMVRQRGLTSRCLCPLFYSASNVFYSFRYVLSEMFKPPQYQFSLPYSHLSPHTYITQVDKSPSGFLSWRQKVQLVCRWPMRWPWHLSVIDSMDSFDSSEIEWDGNYRDNFN